MNDREGIAKGVRGTLANLRSDTRGNTIAIVAASLIPLAGMVGGGVDISRMYIVKTRLQHACDAGALAGRKQMGGGTWAFNNNAAENAAKRFFDANFAPGTYGTVVESQEVRRSFAESAGKVSGIARAPVPMTIMKIFNRPTEIMEVTCDAEMRLPNTDVMFVLDTTGSMASKAATSDADTKIEALKSAVKCFYEIVARLDTTEACTGGAPSGGTGGSVQVRFGFVPYTTNVNVGKLLPNAWLADSWPYQSREALTRTETYYTFPNAGSPTVTNTSNGSYSYGSWSDVQTYSNISKSSACDALLPPDTFDTNGSESGPSGQNTTTNGSTQTVTWTTTQPYSGLNYQVQYDTPKSKQCRVRKRNMTFTRTRTYRRTDDGVANYRQVFDKYRYAKINTNISLLKNGSSWNNSFVAPIGNNGADVTVNWDGCIEERDTVRATSFNPIPSGANDLNIDMTPTSIQSTLWGPALRQLVFQRTDVAPETTTTNYSNPSYFCPREARKLQAWPAASDFEGYVDSLVADGNTYHDIGLIWGARFISPTGIFRSENEFTPQGAEIERHLIFMTDGDTVANATDYAAYGLPRLDRRQTSESSAPSSTDLSNQVNLRFSAICTAVKNKNITLWVISFGTGSNSTTETRLSNCATPGRYFVARNSATLQQTFRSIADQISQLRLTR